MAKRKPGTTTSRGYGSQHQRLRKALAVKVADGGVRCARCGEPIEPGAEWDLGHTDDRSGYTGAEHASCNRTAGSAKRHRLAVDPAPRPVTRW